MRGGFLSSFSVPSAGMLMRVAPVPAGLAPQLAGLYQVNVQIPAGIPPASSVPVRMTGSNAVTIAVK